MNVTVYEGARKMGCTRAEAELLAYYVEVDSLKAAAHRAGIGYGSASNLSVRLKRRLKVSHLAAAASLVQKPNHSVD
jgi:molybdenum-dependent DNA-binding transcriptional regulator ModE